VTTVEEIMSSSAFALGVADVRAGQPMHKDYDAWITNDQWSYERGRCWARLAPRHIKLKRNGKVTREATSRASSAVRCFSALSAASFG
jgi:hypothetical protein